ncbi:MAG: DUF4337 family protein [Solirubrobacteraceae bacterium]
MGGRRAEPDQGGLARDAALMVAVLAAVLAASAFLANESIKEVITGETKAADASARLEAADVKTTIAGANSVLLRVVGAGNSREARAAARTAQALESRIQAELAPVERRLSAYIRRDETERERANQRHLVYELSEVGLQVGIVMAGISILAGRRWLLAAAGLLGTVGVVLVVVGLAS